MANTQKYHWGIRGSHSLVGQYVNAKQEEEKEENEGTHYAELWMGTHPKSPSTVKITEQIKEFLDEEFYNDYLGRNVNLDKIIHKHRNTFLK